MNKLLALVKNELYKIYIMKSVWIMYVFLVSILIVSVLLNIISLSVDTEKQYTNDWPEELKAENQRLMEEIEEKDDSLTEMINMEIIQENNYHINHDIRPYSYHAGDFLLDNLFTISLVSLFVIIVAGGIVANEFRWGTIKQLLIRPISRSMILLSKYIAVLLFTLITVLFLITTSIIIGAIAYGIPAINPEIIVNRPGGLTSNKLLAEIFLQYGFKIINIIVLATLGFMVSIITRSSALAIGLSIFLMFVGTTITDAIVHHEWSKYILFANTDLSVYFTQDGPAREDMTVGFSVAVIAVYMVIFIITSWSVFTKRDVD